MPWTCALSFCTVRTPPASTGDPYCRASAATGPISNPPRVTAMSASTAFGSGLPAWSTVAEPFTARAARSSPSAAFTSRRIGFSSDSILMFTFRSRTRNGLAAPAGWTLISPFVTAISPATSKPSGWGGAAGAGASGAVAAFAGLKSRVRLFVPSAYRTMFAFGDSMAIVPSCLRELSSAGTLAGSVTDRTSATECPWASASRMPLSLNPENQPNDQESMLAVPLSCWLTRPSTMLRTGPVEAIVGSSAMMSRIRTKMPSRIHGQRRRLRAAFAEAGSRGVRNSGLIGHGFSLLDEIPFREWGRTTR